MKKTTQAFYLLLVISCLACLLSPEMFSTYPAKTGLYNSYGIKRAIKINIPASQPGKNQQVLPAIITHYISSAKINHFKYSQPGGGTTLTTQGALVSYAVCRENCTSIQKNFTWLKVIGEKE